MTEVVGGVAVSRETMALLHQFAALVLKWTPHINLISDQSKDMIWDRHIVDSAQAYACVPREFQLWVDIGSGGGFPGIVAAIIGRELAPRARFHLIESDKRKAIFLRTAIRELTLNACVTADRIENVAPLEADVVSARALGSLAVLLPLAGRHLAGAGVAILHKGRHVDAELAEARQNWCFDLVERQSLTDPDASLLVIQRIARVP